MNTIVATSVNKTYIDLAKNWIANLRKFDVKNILIFCLDKDVFDALDEYAPCILSEASTSIAQTRSEWIEQEKFFKYLAPFQYVKKNKCNILFSDVDVIYLKSPIEFFYNKSDGVDIVVMNDRRYDPFHRERKNGKIITLSSNSIVDWGVTDQEKFGELNGSVAYYKYSDNLVRYFESFFNEKILIQYPKGIEDGAAQTVFNDFLKNYKNDIKVRVLSVFDFANGSLMNVNYLKKKVLENASGIHYNFCESIDPEPSRDEKIRRIKNDGFWFI